MSHYEDACFIFVEARKTFCVLQHIAIKIVRAAIDKGKNRQTAGEDDVARRTLWNWLFCFQMIGEHPGHFLMRFPETLDHDREHPFNAIMESLQSAHWGCQRVCISSD